MPKGVLDPNTPRCTARSRGTGNRCKLPAIKGGTVCRRHGGSAPQVVKKARERFNDLIDPMINITEQMVKDAEQGKLTAQEQLALVKFIADRTGFVPGKSVNIDGPAPWEVTFTHIIREAPSELTDGEASELDPIQRRAIEQSYVDAEVIEDEDALERHEREDEAKREAAWESEARDRARAALPHIGPQARTSIDPPKRWWQEDNAS